MMAGGYRELECGLCNLKVVEQYAIDRQKRMTAHWNTEHHNALPPVFDQNTWRTGIVQPLNYMANTETGRMSVIEPPRAYAFTSTCGVCGQSIGGDGDVCNACAAKQPTTPPTTTMTHERAQVLVREVRGSSKRSKSRYQVYVRLLNVTQSIYLPTTDSLADARVQRDTLQAILTATMSPDTVIELLDFI